MRVCRSLFFAWSLAVLGGLASAPACAQALATSVATQGNPMTVVIDASTAPRGFMTTHLSIPVRPGPFKLVFPKWIPGEHGPTGPLGDLAGLRVSANGSPIAWERDKVDMYAFHITVPPGVTRVDATFTAIVNAPNDAMGTRNVAIVNWNRDLLYQADTNSRSVFVKPSIILPDGWKYATALTPASTNGNRIDFEPVKLETLVDSPLDMGRYAQHIVTWTDGTATTTLDMFADEPQDLLDIPAERLAAYKRMTTELLALYGARHWNNYHSMLTLSDDIGFQGIEHHESSDDRAPADFMQSEDEQMDGGDLLPHEMSHSWNGKYRRPDDLTTPNYQVPMQTDLLWVYEGMNQYLGDLISFRAGIRDPKTYPEYLAELYAQLDNERGRDEIPLSDTTTAAPYLYEAGGPYSSLRRTTTDFYNEGELIWLDADTIIREKSGGTKSLDDFLHLYAGPPSSAPHVVTYTRADIEGMLDQVVAYDWHDFFQTRVYDVATHPPAGEIERAGWRLVYTSTPNTYIDASDSDTHSTNAWYSLGIDIGKDGAIDDVRRGSPAWNAGLAPDMKIVAVDGQEFSADVLKFALDDAKTSASPISIIASQNGWYGTYAVDYHDGPRYPHLVRVDGRADMLGQIMAPHAK